MALKTLKDEIVDEVSTILSGSFDIEVTKTSRVPHSDDTAITFPNLDDETQSVKLIETCVLYVDMRRSTQLSMQHKPHTVAKLYSSFVRAMTRCASEYGAEVRGIIGDRVMMIFDEKNCFTNSVKTAQLINSVCKHVMNKHFSHSDLSFGIGIDFGRMLATKIGVRRHGAAQPSYRNLVWLGRPANIASKLTDQANKDAEHIELDLMDVAYEGGILSSGNWHWQREAPNNFVKQLQMELHGIQHKSPFFKSFINLTERHTLRPRTPPILMTKRVFDGFKKESPHEPSLTNGWFKKVELKLADESVEIFGGDVVFSLFQT